MQTNNKWIDFPDGPRILEENTPALQANAPMFYEIVRELAEMPTSSETPGIASGCEVLDNLILLARIAKATV